MGIEIKNESSYSDSVVYSKFFELFDKELVNIFEESGFEYEILFVDNKKEIFFMISLIAYTGVDYKKDISIGDINIEKYPLKIKDIFISMNKDFGNIHLLLKSSLITF